MDRETLDPEAPKFTWQGLTLSIALPDERLITNLEGQEAALIETLEVEGVGTVRLAAQRRGQLRPQTRS